MNLTDRLVKFFKESSSPLLFAGAGVSARAGLPIWSGLIKGMAEFARQYDPLTRQMINERLSKGDYLGAATYYYICKDIPAGEKFSHIRSSLEVYDASKLCGLINLPFKSVVTTNYDRSLFDAYAKCNERSPISFSIDDPSISTASFEKELFVARIHGRAEYPQSIKLCESHYDEIKEDTAYQDLLTNVFTRKQILFVGFSFLDPAIRNVLQTIKERYGVTHEGRHVAVLPNDVGSEFVNELEGFNIERVQYDCSAGHDELWSGFEEIAGKLLQGELELQVESEDPFTPAKQYLASCYARSKIGIKIKPLTNAVAEGIVSTFIARSENDGASEDEIINSVHLELGISKDEASSLVASSVEALVKDGLSKKEEGRYYWAGNEQSEYDDAVNLLASGVADRCAVREGIEVDDGLLVCIKQALSKLIMSRGWDLGAAFAANKIPELTHVDESLFNINECGNLGAGEKKAAIRSIVDLINSPSAEESGYLVDLGRMAFAVELIMQAPHDEVFYRLTLPEKIYLDANVLMPAVTVGHPFHDVYKNTISSLVEASSRSKINLKIIAFYGFLNEVVNHRRLALEQFESQYSDSENLEDLVNQAGLFGVHNLNVFVGAYAMHLVNGVKLSFKEFLSEYAPYENERQLTEWLEKQGVSVCRENEINTPKSEFGDILHSLEKSYSSANLVQVKEAILIRHDALQMAAINLDIKNGVSSVFVTADRRLREMIGNSRYSFLANNMISHVGLMQLIDLLVGSKLDEQGASRLLWCAQVSSDTELVRNYLIDQALNEYDDAIAMAMHDVVDHVAEDIHISLDREGLDMQTNDCSDKARIMKIIGSFENKFFEKMRAVIEKHSS